MRRVAAVAFVAGLLCALLAAGSGLLLVRRRVTVPLARLRAAARASGDGRLDVPLAAPAHLDELSEVAAGFGALRARVREVDEQLLGAAAAAGHELRTPLAVAQMAVSNLQRVDAAGDGDAADRAGAEPGHVALREVRERSLRALSDGIDRMAERVGELAAAAESARRPVEGSRTAVDLAAILRAEGDRAVAAGAAVDVAAAAGRPVLAFATDGAARDAIRELVDNALAHGHAPSEAPRLTLRAYTSRARAIVEVADAGPGLADGAASLAFAPFWRADPTMRDGRDGGLGLGLTRARATVEALGGTLEAAAPGEGPGTSMRLALPRPPRRPLLAWRRRAGSTAAPFGMLAVALALVAAAIVHWADPPAAVAAPIPVAVPVGPVAVPVGPVAVPVGPVAASAEVDPANPAELATVTVRVGPAIATARVGVAAPPPTPPLPSSPPSPSPPPSSPASGPAPAAGPPGPSAPVTVLLRPPSPATGRSGAGAGSSGPRRGSPSSPPAAADARAPAAPSTAAPPPLPASPATPSVIQAVAGPDPVSLGGTGLPIARRDRPRRTGGASVGGPLGDVPAPLGPWTTLILGALVAAVAGGTFAVTRRLGSRVADLLAGP